MRNLRNLEKRGRLFRIGVPAMESEMRAALSLQMEVVQVCKGTRISIKTILQLGR